MKDKKKRPTKKGRKKREKEKREKRRGRIGIGQPLRLRPFVKFLKLKGDDNTRSIG